MKITVIENNEKVFPSLWQWAIDPSMVVLFTGLRNGTVITSCKSNAFRLGSHSDMFKMEEFTPFNGKITLEN